MRSPQHYVHVQFLKDILLQYMSSQTVLSEKRIEMKTKEIHFTVVVCFISTLITLWTAISLLLLLYLRAPPLINLGHMSVDLKYWLVYNKSSVLVIIIYTWCSKYIQ